MCKTQKHIFALGKKFISGFVTKFLVFIYLMGLNIRDFFLVYHHIKTVSKYTEASTTELSVHFGVVYGVDRMQIQRIQKKNGVPLHFWNAYICFCCCIEKENKAVQRELEEKYDSHSWVKERGKKCVWNHFAIPKMTGRNIMSRVSYFPSN